MVHETVGFIRATVAMQQSAQNYERVQQAAPDDTVLKSQLEQDIAKRSVSLFWRMNKLDIESTVREVCELVLEDAGVLAADRHKRAEAMLAMGNLFLKIKPDGSGAPFVVQEVPQALHTDSHQAPQTQQETPPELPPRPSGSAQ